MTGYPAEAPLEIVDLFRWEDRCKIITRDIHGISGLKNITHFRKLASEPSTPLHYHTNIVEIQCIVKGCRNIRLCRDGVIEEYTQTGGDAFVVFPGELHVTGNATLQTPCEVLAVQLNVSEADDFLGLNKQKGRELCRRLLNMKYRHLRMSPEELALLRETFRLFSTRKETDQDDGLMHLHCFLSRIVNLPPAMALQHASADKSIQHVLDHIHENVSEPLTLASLASLSGYSLSRFKTKFREETGQTPAFYVCSAKVERAKVSLVETDQSITDIAYSLGWSSGNYFCTVFKKLTGISPLQYRKNNR